MALESDRSNKRQRVTSDNRGPAFRKDEAAFEVGSSWRVLVLRLGERCMEFDGRMDPIEQMDLCLTVVSRNFDALKGELLPSAQTCTHPVRPIPLPFRPHYLFRLLNTNPHPMLRPAPPHSTCLPPHAAPNAVCRGPSPKGTVLHHSGTSSPLTLPNFFPPSSPSSDPPPLTPPLLVSLLNVDYEEFGASVVEHVMAGLQFTRCVQLAVWCLAVLCLACSQRFVLVIPFPASPPPTTCVASARLFPVPLSRLSSPCCSSALNQAAFETGECNKTRILLRLLALLSVAAVVPESEVLQVLSLLVDTATSHLDPTAGGNPSWQPRADFFVFCVLACLPFAAQDWQESHPDELASLLAAVQGYMEARSPLIFPALVVFEPQPTDTTPPQDYLEELWDRIKACKEDAWKAESVPRPHVAVKERLSSSMRHPLGLFTPPPPPPAAVQLDTDADMDEGDDEHKQTRAAARQRFEALQQFPPRIGRLKLFPPAKTDAVSCSCVSSLLFP
ncbi:unnamed protein product [Closterium sp. NIES-53]